MTDRYNIKFINRLRGKKYRWTQRLFIAEGKKIVSDLLSANINAKIIYTTEPFFHNDLERVISEKTYRKISLQTTPGGVMGVFEMQKASPISQTGWSVVLDSINDPGNLGNIIRLCDWYGIRHLICSTCTVDCYNPKAIQASMGSIARVAVHYRDLGGFLSSIALPKFCMDMYGTNLNTFTPPKSGIIVMGSESHGVSEVLTKYCQRLTIPRQNDNSVPDSLNVATATAIALNHLTSSH